MITHELWRHDSTGEIWAVRLLDGVVVASCGPLPFDDARVQYLAGLDYSEEHAQGLEAARDEFSLYEDR